MDEFLKLLQEPGLLERLFSFGGRVAADIPAREWTFIWAVFSFLAGLIGGHRLALGRDLRKEYNEIAIPVREALLKELDDPRPLWLAASKTDWEQIEAGLRPWKRPGLRAAILARKKAAAIGHRDEVGQMIFDGQIELAAAVVRLLRYVKLK